MKHLKEEFDKLTFKSVLVYTISLISLLAGLTLIFLGMYLPPRGEIHSSVLTAYGITLSYSAALLGISYHFSREVSIFKKTVSDTLSEMKTGKEVSA